MEAAEGCSSGKGGMHQVLDIGCVHTQGQKSYCSARIGLAASIGIELGPNSNHKLKTL